MFEHMKSEITYTCFFSSSIFCLFLWKLIATACNIFSTVWSLFAAEFQQQTLWGNSVIQHLMQLFCAYYVGCYNTRSSGNEELQLLSLTYCPSMDSDRGLSISVLTLKFPRRSLHSFPAKDQTTFLARDKERAKREWCKITIDCGQSGLLQSFYIYLMLTVEVMQYCTAHSPKPISIYLATTVDIINFTITALWCKYKTLNNYYGPFNMIHGA